MEPSPTRASTPTTHDDGGDRPDPEAVRSAARRAVDDRPDCEFERVTRPRTDDASGADDELLGREPADADALTEPPEDLGCL